MAFKMKGPTLLKMTSALKNVRYFGPNTSHEEIKEVNDHNKDVDMKTGEHKTPHRMKSALKQSYYPCPICGEDIDERKLSIHIQGHNEPGGGPDRPPGDDDDDGPGN